MIAAGRNETGSISGRKLFTYEKMTPNVISSVKKRVSRKEKRVSFVPFSL